MQQSYQSDDVEGLQHEHAQPTTGSEIKTKKNNFAYLAIPAIVILCGILYFTSGHAPSKITSESTTSLLFSTKFVLPTPTEIVLTSPGQLMMEASNEYGVYKVTYPYFAEFPGSQFVEPFKSTTIKLSGSLVASGSFTFRWRIDGDDTVYTDSEVTVKLAKTGLIPVSVHAFDVENGNYVGTFKTMLISK